MPLVWISYSQRTLKVFHNTTRSKTSNSLALSFLRSNSHPIHNTGETLALAEWTFVGCQCLCFCHDVVEIIKTPPQEQRLQFLTVQVCSDFDPQKIVCPVPLFPHLFCWRDETGSHDLEFFECWVYSQLFTLLFLSSLILLPLSTQRYIIYISEFIIVLPAILIPKQPSIQSGIYDVLCIRFISRGDQYRAVMCSFSWNQVIA